MLQQALLDLSAWVEKGIAPPVSTSYKVEDGQVIIPGNARERNGIQPVVHLKANGGDRAEVKVGQAFNLEAEIEVPENTGKVVSAQWDFEGNGTFPVAEKFTPSAMVKLKTTHTFSKPGTYFITLRVAAQREADAKTPYTRIQNLERVRIIVK